MEFGRKTGSLMASTLSVYECACPNSPNWNKVQQGWFSVVNRCDTAGQRERAASSVGCWRDWLREKKQDSTTNICSVVERTSAPLMNSPPCTLAFYRSPSRKSHFPFLQDGFEKKPIKLATIFLSLVPGKHHTTDAQFPLKSISCCEK